MWFILRALQRDAEKLANEESTLRRERMDFERNIALLKHDLKEVISKTYVHVHSHCSDNHGLWSKSGHAHVAVDV